MNLSEYLASRGRGATGELASAIGAHAPDISDWRNGARAVPPHHCVAIERATEGAVTRRDLRPADWWRIWPELITRKHPIPQDAA